jgi:LPXTG-motif cell wall-anchored protein
MQVHRQAVPSRALGQVRGGVVRNWLRLVAAGAVVGLVMFAGGGSASASEPRRLCGVEVEFTGIPGNLDVEINGVVYHRPGTGSWSVVFDDADGVFTVRYFNESGEWGSSSFDVGPAQECETTSTTPSTDPATTTATTTPSTGPATTMATTTPSTDPATTRAQSTLPSTGSGSSAPAVAVGALLALAGAVLVVVTRLRGASPG